MLRERCARKRGERIFDCCVYLWNYYSRSSSNQGMVVHSPMILGPISLKCVCVTSVEPSCLRKFGITRLEFINLFLHSKYRTWSVTFLTRIDKWKYERRYYLCPSQMQLLGQLSLLLIVQQSNLKVKIQPSRPSWSCC